jgi:hypothetical protein
MPKGLNRIGFVMRRLGPHMFLVRKHVLRGADGACVARGSPL